jgi:hypothetical protein
MAVDEYSLPNGKLKNTAVKKPRPAASKPALDSGSCQ